MLVAVSSACEFAATSSSTFLIDSSSSLDLAVNALMRLFRSFTLPSAISTAVPLPSPFTLHQQESLSYISSSAFLSAWSCDCMSVRSLITFLTGLEPAAVPLKEKNGQQKDSRQHHFAVSSLRALQ